VIILRGIHASPAQTSRTALAARLDFLRSAMRTVIGTGIESAPGNNFLHLNWATIVQMVASGLRNKEIADTLRIGEGTATVVAHPLRGVAREVGC
jgi:DNA-binding NarL/FixJ family response regulator